MRSVTSSAAARLHPLSPQHRRQLLLGLPTAAVAACAPRPRRPDGDNAASDLDAPSTINPSVLTRPPRPTHNPVTGGTLTLAIGGGPDGVHPFRHTTNVAAVALRAMADTLVRLTPDLKPAPGLAERWDISPDGLHYTFTLRPDVLFHDGTPCTSEAVRFSLTQVMQDTFSSRRADLTAVRDLAILDSLTLRVTLRQPDAVFLYRLAAGAGLVVSPGAVRRLGTRLHNDFTDAGTGPWRFREWAPDRQLVLTRNERYWDRDAAGTRLPYADTLVFKVVRTEAERLSHLRAGTVDATAGFLVSSSPKYIAALRETPGLRFDEAPALDWTGIHLNTTRPPFDRREVRQALAHAIDRAALVAGPVLGAGYPEDVFIGAPLPGSSATFHPYLRQDPVQARSLLQQVGHRRPAFTLTTGMGFQQSMAAAIKEQIVLAGFDVTVEVLDELSRAERRQRGDFQASLGGHNGFVDSDGAVAPLFHSSRASTAANASATRHCCLYGNPSLDALIDTARQTADPEARESLYAQINRLLAAESPSIVLYRNAAYAASTRHILDVPLGPAPTAILTHVWRTY